MALSRDHKVTTGEIITSLNPDEPNQRTVRNTLRLLNLNEMAFETAYKRGAFHIVLHPNIKIDPLFRELAPQFMQKQNGSEPNFTATIQNLQNLFLTYATQKNMVAEEQITPVTLHTKDHQPQSARMALLLPGLETDGASPSELNPEMAARNCKCAIQAISAHTRFSMMDSTHRVTITFNDETRMINREKVPMGIVPFITKIPPVLNAKFEMLLNKKLRNDVALDMRQSESALNVAKVIDDYLESLPVEQRTHIDADLKQRVADEKNKDLPRMGLYAPLQSSNTRYR